MIYTKITDFPDGVRVVDVLLDEIQLENYETAFDRIRNSVSQETPWVVLNLQRVRFMDSLSIGMLVPLKLYATRLGGGLKIVGLSPKIAMLLKALQLEGILDICPDAEAARAEFHAGQTIGDEDEDEGGEESG